MVSSGAPRRLVAAAGPRPAVAARAPIVWCAMRRSHARRRAAARTGPARPEPLGVVSSDAGGQAVVHQRERLVVGVAAAARCRITSVPCGRPSAAATSSRRRRGLEATAPRCAGVRCARGQVVVQAGQLDRAADLAVHDLGADAALADQQALVHQVLDRLAHGRAGQAEAGRPASISFSSRAPGGSRPSRSAPPAAGPPGSTAAPGCSGRSVSCSVDRSTSSPRSAGGDGCDGSSLRYDIRNVITNH